MGDPAQLEAFPGRERGGPVVRVVVDAAHQDRRFRVDDDCRGLGSRFEGASQDEVGQQRRGPGRGEVDAPQARLPLHHRGDQPVLDEAVAEEEDFAARGLGPGAPIGELPVQADGVGEILPSPRDGRLDGDDQDDHPDDAAGDEAGLPTCGGRRTGSVTAPCDRSGRDRRWIGPDRVEGGDGKPDIPAAPNGIDGKRTTTRRAAFWAKRPDRARRFAGLDQAPVPEGRPPRPIRASRIASKIARWPPALVCLSHSEIRNSSTLRSSKASVRSMQSSP